MANPKNDTADRRAKGKQKSDQPEPGKVTATLKVDKKGMRRKDVKTAKRGQ